MVKNLTLIAAAVLALSCGKKEPSTPTPEPTAMSFHELTTKTLDGKPADLSTYKGKVLLVVNTASECGLTPQYSGLEKLYDDYKAKGVVVLGFPSNDFGKQEPGTAAQIQEFCRANYSIEFPMFEKVVTSGAGQSPVYKFLTAKHDAPKWNFHKYLVGKDGQVKQSFGSKTEPLAPEILAAIDAELAK
jgi:glutathione peroxidase